MEPLAEGSISPSCHAHRECASFAQDLRTFRDEYLMSQFCPTSFIRILASNLDQSLFSLTSALSGIVLSLTGESYNCSSPKTTSHVQYPTFKLLEQTVCCSILVHFMSIVLDVDDMPAALAPVEELEHSRLVTSSRVALCNLSHPSLVCTTDALWLVCASALTSLSRDL